MRVLFVFVAVLSLVFAGTGCTAKAKRAYHASRANRYYLAGDYSKAEIEYINVLHSDPANALAYTRLGLIYYDQGRLQRALFFLGRAITMSPDNLEIRIKEGYILSSVGRLPEALVLANYVLDKNPKDDDAPILLAEGSLQPKDAVSARQRLQAMAAAGDRAAIEVALGNMSLREHDIATAAAYFKKAQALDPQASIVNAALGALAWSQGEFQQADANFKAASDASPVRSPRRMQYVRFKMQNGDNAGARTLLEDILKSAPDYVPASLAMAEITATDKKYDECADWLKKVEALDPDNFDALFFEGKLDIVRGQITEAISDLDRMAHTYPQIPYVQYLLGSAYLAANDSSKAAGCFNRALELNPNYVDAILALAQIRVQDNNPGPAIIALEKLRQQQPRLMQAQLLLADAYRLQSRASDSLAIYDSLENMYPTNEQVILLHGAALLQLQDTAGARKKFERALQLVPGQIQAFEELIDLDIASTNFADATVRLNTQIQKEPKSVQWRILDAKILLAQKKISEAEATLLEALKIDPADEGTYLLLAQLYSDSGQNDKALARLNEVMAKDPNSTTVLMLAAKIYSANNDNKGAADAYERILKIDPKDSPALNNLAYLYSEYLNNLDRAYDLAQRARQLLPFNAPTADTLGWICFKKGSYQAALPLLKDAGAKLTDVPEVQYHLGMGFYMTMDEPGARAALQRALQSSANFIGRDQCQRCLAILDINPATADAAARSLLDKRIAEKSDDPVALSRLAHIYQHDGNGDKAIAAYEAVLQTNPKDLDSLVNLTQLYQPKDLKKAYDMAKSASKLAPYDPEVCHTLGRIAFLSGDYQLATSMLQQALQGQPNNPGLLFDYGLASYSIGRIPAAQNALQAAAGLNLSAADAAQARHELDFIALAASPAQAAAAKDRIADALKSKADDVPALMAQAAAAEYGSDVATAEAACEKALGRYPDFTPAQVELARMYSAEPAKLTRAYALASQAHEAWPDDGEVNKIVGIILFKQADYSHASDVLKRAARSLTSDPEAFYYLGSAQFHLKSMAASKASLQQALALKLSGPAADSAKQMLSQIK